MRTLKAVLLVATFSLPPLLILLVAFLLAPSAPTKFVAADPTLNAVLDPAFPIGALLLYLVFLYLRQGSVPIRRYSNWPIMALGELAGDGNSKKSNAEETYRIMFAKAGLPVVSNPYAEKAQRAERLRGVQANQSTAAGLHMKVNKFPGCDSGFTTPDIAIWWNEKKKVVVEYDEYAFHGGGGRLDRVFVDLARNIAYAQAGWAVVRIRAGHQDGVVAEKFPPQYVILGKYDFSISSGVYGHKLDALERAKLLRRIQVAKVASPQELRDWKRMYQELRPTWDRFNYMRQQQNTMGF